MSKQYCSFCGRNKKEIKVLIAGIDGHICNECISQANEIIKEEEDFKSSEDFSINLIAPKEIKAQLDQYVIGQEEAKKKLSVAVITIIND